MTHKCAAAPWTEELVEPQPELRAEFEALGFRVLGAAVRVRPTDEEFDRICAGYGDGDRETLRQFGGEPCQVLVAPDGSAWVRLAWFWWGRYAEVCTVLEDGRVVTTAVDWGVDPQWPRATRRWYAITTDRHREQRLWHSPAASASVVGAPPSTVWGSHRAQVAVARGETTGIRAHGPLEGAIELFDAMQASRMRSAARASLVSTLCALLMTLIPLYFLMEALDPGVMGTVALALPAWAACVVMQKQVWLRARHWRGVQVRFRAESGAAH